MFLSLFIILLGIALILVFLGYLTNERSYSMVGFAFVFVLAISVLFPGTLEVKNGETDITTYNYTGTATLESTSSTTTYNYSNYSDSNSRFFGFWLIMLSIAGFSIQLVDLRRGNPEA